MSNDEYRIKEFYLFYLQEIAERSDFHNSSFVNLHSSFHEVSYKGYSILEFGFKKQVLTLLINENLKAAQSVFLRGS